MAGVAPMARIRAAPRARKGAGEVILSPFLFSDYFCQQFLLIPIKRVNRNSEPYFHSRVKRASWSGSLLGSKSKTSLEKGVCDIIPPCERCVKLAWCAVHAHAHQWRAPQSGRDGEDRHDIRLAAGRAGYRTGNTLGGARASRDTLQDAQGHGGNLPGSPGGQFPASFGTARQCPDTDLDAVSRTGLPCSEPFPQSSDQGGRCRRSGFAQQPRNGGGDSRRGRGGDRQSDQPATGTRTDIRHPARNGCQGGCDSEGVSENGHRPEMRRSSAPCPFGPHGSGSRSQHLSQPAEKLDRAAGAAEKPG